MKGLHMSQGMLRSIMLKVLLLATLLFAVPEHAYGKDTNPKVVSQHQTKDGGRAITVKNPRGTIWAYFECENVISVQPIRIPHGTHVIIILPNEDDVAVSDFPCFLKYWVGGENAP